MLNLKTQIQTDRLDLQIYEPSLNNAQEIFEFLKSNNGSFCCLYDIDDKNTAEDVCNFLTKHNKSENRYVYRVYLKGQKALLGVVAISNYDVRHRRVEMGFFLGEHASLGYMKEAVQSATEALFDADCHKVSVMIEAQDIAARTICEKCNFTLRAILEDEKFNPSTKEYEDVFLYSIINKN